MLKSIVKIPGILTETVVYSGTGLFGFIYVCTHRTALDMLQYIGMASIGTGAILAMCMKRVHKTVDRRNVIFISGCDSGLGYTLAHECYDLKMSVVAACLNKSSDGARRLSELNDQKRMTIVELDVQSGDSIRNVYQTVRSILTSNSELVFTGLINNAGVMCFGEFEWLTNEMIDSQININFIGTIKLTKEFLPLIRNYKARIITVTSHCALQPLPTISVYGGTKAALCNWSDSLRIELTKYGVTVVNFIPGSLMMNTNIAAKQLEYNAEQNAAFSQEQLAFYGNYFNKFHNFLKGISGYKPINRINCQGLMHTFHNAVLDVNPKATYKYQPWRYAFYHFLFRITPVAWSDWLVIKFMKLPGYVPQIGK